MKKELEAFRGGMGVRVGQIRRGYMREMVFGKHWDGIWVDFHSSGRPAHNL